LQSGVITIMTQAALKAARGLLRDFGEVEQLQVSRRGPSGVAAHADIRAERTIQYELMKGRPQYGFLMEESGEIPGESPDDRWIVDPLDGSSNFLHGVPHFAVSIALERQGVIVAGVIYDPLRNELFCAEKGVGAYMNDRRMRSSSRRALGESLVGMPASLHGKKGGEADARAGRILPVFQRLVQERTGVRCTGSTALDLAYVACGRLDAAWAPNTRLWDVAAGVLMVQEAGGRADFPTPATGPWPGDVTATAPHLYAPFATLLQSAP
jgi:myo-inositol-1(or 4)-monophosphatase